jgi:hypothetical protein
MGTCQIASMHVNQSDYDQRLFIIPTKISKYFKPEKEMREGGRSRRGKRRRQRQERMRADLQRRNKQR